MMGSPESDKDRAEDEWPQREVTIAKPFAVGKTELTFDEWDTCVAAGACQEPLDSGFGRGDRPVIHVSWNEAKAYTDWLSRMTGKEYGLLTETEWEYAARGGTATRYSWGDEAGEGNANCSGCKSQWDGKQTAPVGSFKPNGFGLYDMHGNVWEWVQDCYVEKASASAPKDGSPAKEPTDCGSRVLRGGSWFNDPGFMRAAYRYGYFPGLRYSVVGFRVMRVLSPGKT
jgi:formylglycine-generating enzyme required for sulfatase activity